MYVSTAWSIDFRIFKSLCPLQAPNKKYFKRGDLAAKEEEEYWKRHRKVNDEKPASPEKVCQYCKITINREHY